MSRAGRARTVALIRQLRRIKLAAPRRRPVRPLQPDGIRREYFNVLSSRVLAPARVAVARFLPTAIDIVIHERDADRARRQDADGVNGAMDAAREVYERSFHPHAAEAVAASIAARTSSFQKQEIDKQAKSALGVDLFHHEPNLVPVTKAFVTENVALIKSLPSTYFSDVEKAVANGVASGMRHEDIAKILAERYGVAENRAKLIARDQVGKFYGRLAEVRQRALGVSGFTWRTVNDNRVRDEHAALEGESFTWSDPPSEGVPGEAVNCRCFAEPDFTDILDDVGVDEDGFDIAAEPDEIDEFDVEGAANDLVEALKESDVNS